MGRRLPIALIAAAALLAGCGGASSNEASKSAEQIRADAQKAALAAQGVHASGWITQSGKRIDLTFDLAAGNGKGSLVLGVARADVQRLGDVAYMRANSAFWTAFADSRAAFLLHDKWLSGHATKAPFSAFARFLSLRALVGYALGHYGKLQKLGVRTFKGQKVIALKDPAGKETLLIAATGTPYPVAATGQGELDFTNWDKPVDVKAPHGAVDISAFGG